HHLRLMQKRDGKRQLLLPAEGDRANELVAGVAEPETVENALDAPGEHAFRDLINAAVQLDVLADGEIVVQRESLAHVPDDAFDPLALRGDVEPRDLRRAAARPQQTGQDADRGGLPG